MRKRVVICAIIIVAAVLAGSMLVTSGQVFFESVFERPGTSETIDRTRVFSEEYLEWRAGYYMGEWEVTTREGITLIADYYEAEEESRNYIVIVKDYTTNAVYMEDLAKAFWSRGYNVLIPDMRAHGRSGGKLLGMGYPDSRDLLEWVRKIEKYDSSARIVLYGFASGGAASLLTLPSAPASVVGIISDSSFDSLSNQMKHLAKNYYDLPSFPYLFTGNLYCKIKEGYFFGDVSPKNAVVKAKIPLLLIHGENDEYTPPKMAENIFSSAPNDQNKTVSVNELLIIPGAGHCQSMLIAEEEYFTAVDKFLSRIGK